MNLESYALRHKAEICDWSETWDKDAAARGWRCFALFTEDNDSEPKMLLINAPDSESFQVRNFSSGMATGEMLTERQVKAWIKSQSV
ncbi:hypothetical protein RYA05_03155 [Pseudomonas syringae pv. actinidiae]|nr:hypothetical protein [Pseudomonas syringae pv. actinidiae]